MISNMRLRLLLVKEKIFVKALLFFFWFLEGVSAWIDAVVIYNKICQILGVRFHCAARTCGTFGETLNLMNKNVGYVGMPMECVVRRLCGYPFGQIHGYVCREAGRWLRDKVIGHVALWCAAIRHITVGCCFHLLLL